MGRRFLALLLFAVAAAVFLIRLRQPGPYAFPEQGNLRAALLAFALGVWFWRPWLETFSGRRLVEIVLRIATPIVLFFALYATLAELEEVVVVESMDADGRPALLRLWVMDADDTEWVNMSRSKAIAHGLTSARVEFLRDGLRSCRQATLVEDRSIVQRNSRLGYEKYAVKRFAVAIGVFGGATSPELVSVRLDPCADG